MTPVNPKNIPTNSNATKYSPFHFFGGKLALLAAWKIYIMTGPYRKLVQIANYEPVRDEYMGWDDITLQFPFRTGHQTQRETRPLRFGKGHVRTLHKIFENVFIMVSRHKSPTHERFPPKGVSFPSPSLCPGSWHILVIN